MTLQYTVSNGDICISDKNDVVLTIQEVVPEEGKKQVVVSLSGSLRSDAVVWVEEELNAFVTLKYDILVDMRNISYISVSAQRCFLDLQRYADRIGGGIMVLKVPDGSLYAGLEETGLTELLRIER